ncbi:MAG TPA: DUF4249 domain-containing protein [Bacteroidales bacterium]|nr:DUF4249 domain-containing protein [Bacteroidales bacterium]
MQRSKNILIFILILSLSGCITQFIPETDEGREMIVVEGLVTDHDSSTVKLSKSFPLGEKRNAVPLSGCSVWITDDMQRKFDLTETQSGIYIMYCRGEVGRKYTLHINTNNSYTKRYTFSSYPVEMLPVPPVDTIYYEKVPVTSPAPFNTVSDQCQIYIDAHDPDNLCKFYRWDYTETWEIRIPFSKALNSVCWVTDKSSEINVKSTDGMSESVISQYPLHYITNETDRLKVKYSILVNQYSLPQEEFSYWEKLKAVTQNVGSLYDVTPAAIPNNIYCVENPDEKVLGYFSVSAKTSKRFFIRDFFMRQPNLYKDCIHDTIFGNYPVIPYLNTSVWILEYEYGPSANPPYTAVTYTQGCADCTVRGTNIKPLFWK